MILGAGRGSRMSLKTSKILAPICNKPILLYIIESLKNIDFLQKYIVLGDNLQEISPFLPKDFEIVIQPQPKGTGDAFMCACKLFKNFDGEVLLLNGDGPIVDSKTINEILALNDAKMSIFTGILPKKENLGRIKRKNGKIIDIIEAKDCTQKDRKITEKNLGIYCFDNKILQKYIYNLDCKNAQGEYYVTDLVKIFAQNNKKIITFSQKNDDFFIPSVNNLLELSECQSIMQRYINIKLLENGVNILYPNTAYVDGYSAVGEFTTIFQNCSIFNSKIGKNCIIYPNCVIKNAILGDNCVIGSGSVIENCNINSNIPPLSYLSYDKKIS